MIFGTDSDSVSIVAPETFDVISVGMSMLLFVLFAVIAIAAIGTGVNVLDGVVAFLVIMVGCVFGVLAFISPVQNIQQTDKLNAWYQEVSASFEEKITPQQLHDADVFYKVHDKRVETFNLESDTSKDFSLEVDGRALTLTISENEDRKKAELEEALKSMKAVIDELCSGEPAEQIESCTKEATDSIDAEG